MNYELLLACYRSGQISERQWQGHLKDEKLRQWLEKQGFGHLRNKWNKWDKWTKQG